MIFILHSLFFQSAGLPQVTAHVVMKEQTIWNMSSQPTSTVVATSVHLGSFLNVSRTQLRLPNPESGRYPVCAPKKVVAAMVSFIHSHCPEVNRLKWLPQLIANVDITHLNEVAKKEFITKSHFKKMQMRGHCDIFIKIKKNSNGRLLINHENILFVWHMQGVLLLTLLNLSTKI